MFHVGCVGRLTQFAESGDGRYLIQLTGVSRFRIENELSVETPYRQCKVTYQPFVDDFTARKGEDEVDRKALLRALHSFLKANKLKADWDGIENAPNEALVNALAMMSPYDAAEKQAMLEAPGPENPRRDPDRRHRNRDRQEQDAWRNAIAVNS